MSNDSEQTKSKVKDAASEAVSSVAKDVAEVAEHVKSKLPTSVEQASADVKKSAIGKAASDAIDKGADKVDEARKYFKGKDGRVLADLESFMHDRPMTSAVLAFLAGVFATKMLNGSQRN